MRHEIADFVCTTNGSIWNVVLRMVSKHASRVLEGRDYRTGSTSEAKIYPTERRILNVDLERIKERCINEKRESLIHRTATTSYPCCGQALGEFRGSWSCMTFPMQR